MQTQVKWAQVLQPGKGAAQSGVTEATKVKLQVMRKELTKFPVAHSTNKKSLIYEGIFLNKWSRKDGLRVIQDGIGLLTLKRKK